jgi:hypothetical protein
VAAVSPDDPATLVLYTVANSPGLDASRLLVSHDGGDNFSVALERPEIRGAGYSGDGTLWVAARDGLYAASADLSQFDQTSVASELGCVLERQGALFVCGHYAGVGSGSSGIGISTNGGASFEPWLDFESVDAPVECPADSPTAVLCAQPWRDWEMEMTGVLPAAGPGTYGPIGATPDATLAPASVAPEGDAIDTPIGESGPVADEPMSATCALGSPAASGAAGRAARELWWLAAGWLACLGLRRRSRLRVDAA